MSIITEKPSYEMTTRERKARRIYQRMLTGLTIARNQGKDMRFLTLTTSKERRLSRHKIGETDEGKPIWEMRQRTPKDSFDILRERIKRATMEKDKFTGFHLNKYYCLRTEEGLGVLHVIFWGGLYIPIQWLKAVWYEIHGAYEVFIEFVHNKKNNVNRLVGYLLDRYLLNQPIERMSYGWGWAWLGFCKSWENIKTIYSKQGLRRGKGNYRLSTNEVTYDKFHLRRDYTQSVPFWKGVLWQPPKTSRQSKLKYPNRGLNKNYF